MNAPGALQYAYMTKCPYCADRFFAHADHITPARLEAESKRDAHIVRAHPGLIAEKDTPHER